MVPIEANLSETDRTYKVLLEDNEIITVSNETNTKRIQALIVEHPSGSNGKSRAKWHTILKAFLKLDD